MRGLDPLYRADKKEGGLVGGKQHKSGSYLVITVVWPISQRHQARRPPMGSGIWGATIGRAGSRKIAGETQIGCRCSEKAFRSVLLDPNTMCIEAGRYSLHRSSNYLKMHQQKKIRNEGQMENWTVCVLVPGPSKDHKASPVLSPLCPMWKWDPCTPTISHERQKPQLMGHQRRNLL